MYQVMVMVATTVHTIILVITMERGKLRMRLLHLDQTLTLMLMAGVSYLFISLGTRQNRKDNFSVNYYSVKNVLLLSGYWGGYGRPYYGGYYYGKRQAEDETAASGPNPDADAHGWGELLYSIN